MTMLCIPSQTTRSKPSPVLPISTVALFLSDLAGFFNAGGIKPVAIIIATLVLHQVDNFETLCASFFNLGL